MSYQFVERLSDGRYKFRIIVEIYRDALSGGALFDNPLSMTVFDMDNMTSRNFSIPANNFNITTLPINDLGPCARNVPNVRIEKIIYTYDDIISLNNNGYVYSHQRCCRSDVISNLNRPGDQGSTYSVYISREAMLANNSTPAFNQEPPLLVCVGSNFEYQFAATDGNAQRLRYYLCNPSNGGNSSSNNPAPTTMSRPPYGNVNFLNGYGPTNPFGPNVDIDLDPNTGTLKVRPDRVGIFTLAVCVDELDINNQIISSVKRDIQFNIADCIVPSAIISPPIGAAEKPDGSYATCKGLVNTFVNKSTGAQSYFWDFGVEGVDNDTSIAENPSFIFPDSGTYDIKLIINKGQSCADSIIFKLSVYPVLDVDFDFTTYCENKPVEFKSTATSTVDPIVKQTWYQNNTTLYEGTNFEHVFPATGPYPVMLMVETDKGCRDSIVKDISLPKFTEAQLQIQGGIRQGTSDTFALCQDNLHINATTSIPSSIPVLWKLNNATYNDRDFNTVLPDTGTYRLQLIANPNTFCADTLTNWVRVLPTPIPDFNYVTYCKKFPVEFTTIQNRPFDGIKTIAWNFGDGTTSSELNPVKDYASVRNYNVRHTVTTLAGCTASVTKTVTVHPDPVADFNIIGTQKNQQYIWCDDLLSVNFEDKSVNAQTFNWNIGNGLATANTQNTGYQFPKPDVYDVRLIINPGQKCVDTISKQITLIDGISKMDFAVNDVCVNTPQTFTNQSTAVLNDFATFQWDFGNGNTSSARNPRIPYAAPGSFPIKLIAVTALGCRDTIIKNITIFPAPTVDFINNDICPNTPQVITNKSSISSGQITEYLWKIPNQDNQSTVHPVIQYNQSGFYNITLIATSDHGCVDSTKKVVEVRQSVIPNFTYENQCVSAPVWFKDSTISPYNDIVEWEWQPVSGVTLTNAQTQHKYDEPGSYPVQLTIVSSIGCRDSIVKNIDLRPHPIADFVIDGIDLGLDQFVKCDDSKEIRFINQSIDNATNYWEFQMFGTSTDASPVFAFGDTGTYHINLTINPGTLCSDFIQKKINVLPGLKMDFSHSLACEKNQIQLTDLSSTVMNDIIRRQWTHEGNVFSEEVYPKYIFDKYGTYDVQLIVQTQRGCLDSITQSIKVHALPDLDFELEEACPQQETKFPNTSKSVNGNNIASYFWNFGNGKTSTDQHPTTSFESPGPYEILLRAVTDAGCVDSIQEVIVVRDFVEPMVSLINKYYCEDEQMIFSAEESKGIYQNVFWNFDNGLSSNQTIDTIYYEEGGIYEVSLTLRDELCGEFNKTYSVQVTPTPVANLGPDIALCPTLTTTLDINNSGVLDSIKWSTGASGSNNITVDGNAGKVYVEVYLNGCFNSDTITITPSCEVVAPKIFSPNADGINDRFNVMPSNVLTYQLFIYNRWGHLIFTTNDLDKGWDGTYQGEPQPMDNYTYYSVGVRTDGSPFTIEGAVMLIR